jgi:hypothetical protein
LPRNPVEPVMRIVLPASPSAIKTLKV